MDRRKILLSCYACEPGRGSEPGVGWNVAREMARHHDVWVLTRNANRAPIEAELARNPVDGLHFAYYDLPAWACWINKDERAVQAYYYAWQATLHRPALALHHQVGFDLAHHVTYVRYWSPSLPALLPIPYLWGPVGGAESAPRPFWKDFGWKARLYETARDVARWIGEHDPLVRKTARHATVAVATTRETAARLRHLGATCVEQSGESGLNPDEIARLGLLPAPDGGPVRFISMGRLIHWKGFHLGLRAFAEAALPDAEYWMVGDGPERPRLEAMARQLGVADRVRFWGWQQRADALDLLAQCHVLVHPSLHDSGGWVCVEAMAAGRPVLCLDLGGPATQVTDDVGARVAAHTPAQAASDLATQMRRLRDDEALRAAMGAAGRHRAREVYALDVKIARLADRYRALIDEVHPAPAVAA